MFNNKVILATAGFLAATLAHAGNYPMSGQDTVYHSTSGEELTLVHGNASISLEDGHAYRLRFSNASKSFHIMPGDGSDNEFKVSGGFPGGNLQNFTGLQGSKFGNSGVMFNASTTNQTLSTSGIYERDYSCSYVCGSQTVCNDVPEQVCNTVNNQTTCTTVTRSVCTDQDVYCSGTESWNVQDVTSGTVYKASFNSAYDGHPIGEFDGTFNVSTSTEQLERLSSSCPY